MRGDPSVFPEFALQILATTGKEVACETVSAVALCEGWTLNWITTFLSGPRNDDSCLNMNSGGVKDHNVLLSFGVSFYKVGMNASPQVARLLKGDRIGGIEPLYPKKEDHEAYLSLKRLKKIDFKIKDSLSKDVYIVQ